MGRSQQIRCHGDERRFQVMAAFIYEYYGHSVKYIADVAGGQGVLSRLLNKRYNYVSEVIDPRHYTLIGVDHRESTYSPEMATYYDLIVGLHPDEATRPVVESALFRPVIVVPCCNYWDQSRKLNSIALVDEICLFYESNHVHYERIVFDFNYPNIGVISRPPK